jgi:cell division septal protein FtsQ
MAPIVVSEIEEPEEEERREVVKNEEKKCRCAGVTFGIAGWRRRCVFCLIVLLIVMVVANLALTLWIMAVMRFTTVSIVFVVNYDVL